MVNWIAKIMIIRDLCKNLHKKSASHRTLINLFRIAVALAKEVVGCAGACGSHQVVDKLEVAFVECAERVGKGVGIDGVALLAEIFNVL